MTGEGIALNRNEKEFFLEEDDGTFGNQKSACKG
jgi:hypothetical protein